MQSYLETKLGSLDGTDIATWTTADKQNINFVLAGAKLAANLNEIGERNGERGYKSK
jgi:hypothetical protein